MSMKAITPTHKTGNLDAGSVGASQDGPDCRERADAPARILVAHHDRQVADTLTEILTGAGHQVMTVYECLAALRAAAEFRPDCLISDVVMRQMYGLELAAAIRNVLPGIRVLLLSGLGDNSSIFKHGEKLKLDFDILQKPIRPVELIELINPRH